MQNENSLKYPRGVVLRLHCDSESLAGRPGPRVSEAVTGAGPETLHFYQLLG